MSDVEDEVMQAGEEEEEVEEELEEEDDQEDDDDDMNQEDDGGGEEEEKSVSSGSKKSSKSQSQSSTVGSKKKIAPPTKRKTPSSSSSATSASASASGASSSAKNVKKPKLITNEATAKETVRVYMKQQNRPYTALIVFENLHHAIKKPTLIRIMDELVEEGHLQAKDFKKVRIYMAKQLDSDTCTPAELDALSAREASLREELVEQRAKNSKLEGQIRALQSEPSDEELAKLLAQYKKQIDALNTKLARFKNDKNLVTKESMNKAQANFNECFKQWKLRKRAADDLIGQMCGDEGDPKDVCERFRLETDEEAGDKIGDWKDLAKDLPKK